MLCSANRPRRGEQVQADQGHDPDDREHAMTQPPRPVDARTSTRGRDKHHPERTDRHEDVQPQLRPAIGVLVEPEAQGSRDEHDRREADERKERRRGTAGVRRSTVVSSATTTAQARQAAATSSKKPRRA